MVSRIKPSYNYIIYRNKRYNYIGGFPDKGNVLERQRDLKTEGYSTHIVTGKYLYWLYARRTSND